MNLKINLMHKISDWIKVSQTLIIFLCTFNTVFALPSDNQAAIEMRSGSADISQETHRGVYLGNVELDQGSTHIRAAKAITEGNKQNQLTKAIISGDKEHLAHYWVMQSLDKPELHAYADTIYYLPQQHLIKLVGHAKVIQGNNSFSAPIICYDILHQHVTSEHANNARTVIIFHPDKKIIQLQILR